MKLFDFVFEVDNDHWLVPGALLDLEWPVLHVFLNRAVTELSSNKSFGIKDSIPWISCNLIFGGITYNSFILGECNI